MANLNNITSKFPPIGECVGDVIPLYYEPILFSGEKITCAVAAQTVTGEFKVIPTLSNDKLLCMFGKNAYEANKIISFVVDELTDFLKGNNQLNNYIPSIKNIIRGNGENLFAHDIDGLLKSEIQSFASLSNINFTESLDHKNTVSDGMNLRWLKQVKAAVCETKPQLANNFNVKLGKSNHKYDFICNQYLANFSAMNPAYANQSLGEAKKKLWDLTVAPQYDFTLIRQELLVFIPKKDDLVYSAKQYNLAKNHLEQLEQEADKQKVRLVVFNNPLQASERIIEAA